MQHADPSEKPRNRQLSLRGLRTFVVAARHLSFQTAAEELYVTASAVSHQIKSLEEELGQSLFDRGARTIALTDAGAALYEEIGPLIAKIDEATARFRTKLGQSTLRVSVQPFFASELLVQRLAEFTERHPDIDIALDTNDESSEKHPASSDISIRIFSSAPANLFSEALFPLRIVPACSRELLDRITARGRITPTFTAIVHTGRPGDWNRWIGATGMDTLRAARVVKLNTMVAVVRAAEQGLGVAMVPMPACQSRFDDGRLVRVHEHEEPTPDRYYFVCSHQAVGNRAVAAFRRWVMGTFSAWPEPAAASQPAAT